jgi:hypothetical protein
LQKKLKNSQKTKTYQKTIEKNNPPIPKRIPKNKKTQKQTVFEGSLEVKLPTIWTDEKQRWEESEKRRAEERDQRKERMRRRKMQARETVAKSRNTVFSQ